MATDATSSLGFLFLVSANLPGSSQAKHRDSLALVSLAGPRVPREPGRISQLISWGLVCAPSSSIVISDICYLPQGAEKQGLQKISI